MKGLTPLAGCLVMLLACGQAIAGADHLAQYEVPADAEYVGSEDCAACHEDAAEFYAHSPHNWELGLAVPGTDIVGCEACHGPGSLHVDEGGDGWILGADALQKGRDALCTQCHIVMDVHYASSNHAGTDVSCADCHRDQAHFGGLAVPANQFRNQSEFCLQCHTEQVSQFRMPSRHKVLEGHMACTDCHNPHGSAELTDWDGLNGACLKCHTKMAGPFVFEHDGVEGEDCLSCHRPHGSQHDKMLTQSGNGLCLQCHFEQGFNAGDDWSLAGDDHALLLSGEKRCYECHREVHGSNVDPTFRDR